METETISNTIYECILPYITPTSEKSFIENLSSEFFTRGISPEATEEVMKKVYQSLIENETYNTQGKPYSWSDYEVYIDELYLEDISPNAGLDGLYVLLSQSLSKSEAKDLINQLKACLKPYESKELYELRIGSDKYIVMNKARKLIQHKYVKTTKTKDITTLETVINACPSEVIIHDSPLTDMGRTFTLKWISKTSQRVFETKQSTISEIESYLQEAGWVITPRYLRGALAAIIDISISNKLADIKMDIDNPGFYYDTKDKKLLQNNIELPEWNTDNLKKSFKVLNDLHKYGNLNPSKLATVIKWGLISPFNFARKQYGSSWMPWLYLNGKAKSGKTTAGLIALFLWGVPDDINNIGGSGFDTPARVGEKLGQTTLPLLVNEPEGALTKPSVMALIKSAIESTTARGKFSHGKYRNLPSFSPVIMTANIYLPTEDALLRRFESIHFSHNEANTDSEAKEFTKRFGLDNFNHSPLKDLHYLASFVASEMISNPDYLGMDWKELANYLLNLAYAEVGMVMPTWLSTWAETATLEDLDDEEIEDIRMFLIDEINSKSKQIKIYNENGSVEQEPQYTLDDGVIDNEDFKNRIWNVLNQRLIPWCGVRQKGELTQVYFTAGIKRDIIKYTKTCKDLKSISELLEWKYTSLRIPKKTKVMVVEFDDFVEFLSPTMEDE